MFPYSCVLTGDGRKGDETEKIVFRRKITLDYPVRGKDALHHIENIFRAKF